AMHDVFTVRVIESLGNLQADLKEESQVFAAVALKTFLEVGAVGDLHNDVVAGTDAAFRLLTFREQPEFVEYDNIGMVKAAHQRRFLLEAHQVFVTEAPAAMDDFNRDRVGGIFKRNGFVDRAHATATDFPGDAVAIGDPLANQFS